MAFDRHSIGILFCLFNKYRIYYPAESCVHKSSVLYLILLLLLFGLSSPSSLCCSIELCMCVCFFFSLIELNTRPNACRTIYLRSFSIFHILVSLTVLLWFKFPLMAVLIPFYSPLFCLVVFWRNKNQQTIFFNSVDVTFYAEFMSLQW